MVIDFPDLSTVILLTIISFVELISVVDFTNRCLQIISLVWFGLLFFTVTILKHRSAIAGTVQILLFTTTFYPLTFFPPTSTTTFCVD